MNLREFQLTNDLLNKIVGGQQNTSKYFAFSGTNAVEEARAIASQPAQNCSCGCFCNDGSGNGGGAGN